MTAIRALMLMMTVWVLAPGVAISASAADSGNFKLGPGDLIEISVWEEPSLTRSVRVRPDGLISFPLAGEVQASGRTVPEVQVELEKLIRAFVPDAPVTVMLVELASKKIYVLGSVQTPGVIPLYEPIRVLQALSRAGGLDQYASDDIIILRETEKGQVVLEFDYDEVSGGKKLEQNIFLQSNDTIVVP
ncbi:polysaccharide biosynthesis/export family protein [Desulfocurvibacter africanus]|uniref:polysaccharide biosynthesis/export family protein n=1 Tax=Desulfocurvibacter africanus TaxID=873 RepID=UPI00040F4D04|nr:polysaccharide biosynthesis/export family protein [Desulfocurvibacter africanus]